MTEDEHAKRGIDLERPNAARVYDYMIGGGLNYAAMVQADAEYVDDVLAHPTTEAMLDFDKPVMVVMAAFVHFIPDSRDPAGLIARYFDPLAPGSYLALSSGTWEGQGEESQRSVSLYEKSGTPLTLRSPDELRALVKGFRNPAAGRRVHAGVASGRAARSPARPVRWPVAGGAQGLTPSRWVCGYSRVIPESWSGG